MGKNSYAGYVCFIVPIKQGEIIPDINALRMVEKINNWETVDNVFLRHEEEYLSLERYCHQNSIEIGKIEDNPELLEEITKHYGLSEKRFVYVTSLENSNSLGDIISELADYGCHSEIRIPSSF